MAELAQIHKCPEKRVPWLLKAASVGLDAVKHVVNAYQDKSLRREDVTVVSFATIQLLTISNYNWLEDHQMFAALAIELEQAIVKTKIEEPGKIRTWMTAMRANEHFKGKETTEKYRKEYDDAISKTTVPSGERVDFLIYMLSRMVIDVDVEYSWHGEILQEENPTAYEILKFAGEQFSINIVDHVHKDPAEIIHANARTQARSLQRIAEEVHVKIEDLLEDPDDTYDGVDQLFQDPDTTYYY